MQLTPIPIISRASQRFQHISFQWAGEDPDDTVGEIDPEIVDAFNEINSIASVAYIIAATEWIYWLVRDDLDHVAAQDYLEYIEAMWVWECEIPRRIPPDPFLPKVRRRSVLTDAVEIGLESITNAIASVRDHEASVDAAFMSQLCQIVLPDESEFKVWHAIVLKRLVSGFPADSTHFDRVRVSRQYFDTDAEAPVGSNDFNCSEMVSQENSGMNRYLPLRKAV